MTFEIAHIGLSDIVKFYMGVGEDREKYTGKVIGVYSWGVQVQIIGSSFIVPVFYEEL